MKYRIKHEIKVTDKQWNYHLVIQELEKGLNGGLL